MRGPLGVALVGLLVVGPAAIGARCSRDASPAAPATATPSPPPSNKYQYCPIGDKVSVMAGNAGTVYLSADLAAFQAATKAMVADDTYGYTEAMLAGGTVPVPSGTPALVIDFDGPSGCRVRVLSGPSVNRAGWLFVSELRRLY